MIRTLPAPATLPLSAGAALRTAAGLAGCVAATCIVACARAPQAPGQPVAFSHAVHARMEIDCGWCHRWAAQHAVAGLPRARACAGCHKPEAARTPDLARLREVIASGEEIAWARVVRLPRYNRFSHRRHVAAHVDCADCHGAVASMEATVRAVEMTMAWCVACHEQRGADTDCLVCHL